jgi:hypothetical protein
LGFAPDDGVGVGVGCPGVGVRVGVGCPGVGEGDGIAVPVLVMVLVAGGVPERVF